MAHTTYQLHIVVRKAVQIQIGALGLFGFPPGRYVYTGSARKNLEARIARHRNADKKLRWHIDYLLSHPDVYITRVDTSIEDECTWNQAVGGGVVVPRFGASDCRAGCRSHLRYLGSD